MLTGLALTFLAIIQQFKLNDSVMGKIGRFQLSGNIMIDSYVRKLISYCFQMRESPWSPRYRYRVT
jgi:hypothetical protein